MVKKRKAKTKKESKVVKKFVGFGNKKKVFLGILIASIVLTLLSTTIIENNRFIQMCLLLIWIFELIYFGMYFMSKKKD
jgi:dipeptide/tripeptide permease